MTERGKHEHEGRRCPYCGEGINPKRRSDTRFCNTTCRWKFWHEKQEWLKAEQEKESLEQALLKKIYKERASQGITELRDVFAMLLKNFTEPPKKVSLFKRVWRKIFARKRSSLFRLKATWY